MDFGKRLSMVIEERGITQSELSEKAHIAPSSVSRYCSGKLRPQASTLERISKCLDISSDVLLGIDCASTDTDLERSLLFYCTQISDEKKGALISYAEYLYTTSK